VGRNEDVNKRHRTIWDSQRIQWPETLTPKDQLTFS